MSIDNNDNQQIDKYANQRASMVARGGVGQKGLIRRPDRTITLTEEVIANLPPALHTSDVWYDAADTALMVWKGKKLSYRLWVGSKSRRALGKKTTTPYIALNASSLDDARAAAAHLHEAIAVAMARYQEDGLVTPIRDEKAVPPAEDLLKDLPPEERANYDALMTVLMDAFEQASSGKGHERHGGQVSFERQDMQRIVSQQSTLDFPLGQAMKKMMEGSRLPWDRARAEFLGAIVYIAGAIVWGDRNRK